MIVTEEPPPRLAAGEVLTGSNRGGCMVALRDFLARCLQREPDDRATVDELLAHDFVARGVAATPECLRVWLAAQSPEETDELPVAYELAHASVSRPRRVSAPPVVRPPSNSVLRRAHMVLDDGPRRTSCPGPVDMFRSMF